MNTLTHKQKRFVAEYVQTRSAPKAYVAAGYSPNGAKANGPKMLQRPEVAAAVERALSNLAIRTEITQDRVLHELGLLAFSDVTHYEVDDAGNVRPAPGAPAGAMRAVSSIKRKVHFDVKGNVIGRDVELRLWDKPTPLKLAGRHVGLFPSKDHEALKEAAREILEKRIAEARAARAAAEAQKAVEPVSKVIDVEASPAPAKTGGTDG